MFCVFIDEEDVAPIVSVNYVSSIFGPVLTRYRDLYPSTSSPETFLREENTETAGLSRRIGPWITLYMSPAQKLPKKSN